MTNIKKYKLIKEWPNPCTFLEIGDTITEILGENLYYYIKSNIDGRLFRSEVENNSEFWEEIK